MRQARVLREGSLRERRKRNCHNPYHKQLLDPIKQDLTANYKRNAKSPCKALKNAQKCTLSMFETLA